MARIDVIASVVVLVCAKAPTVLVLRDAAGFAGLTGLAAWLLGTRLAWAPPVAAGVAVVVLPALPEPYVVVLLTWPAQPPGSVWAAVTATFLAALGGVLYAVRGASRPHIVG
ncbi:hypothetical protein [Micromonospora avicenniae]|uniref:hypothetical protein n=1 Tax=Micromonospora avicenniae TaxID=1198245 RepID=UPI003421F2D1